jgi:hypothetical protein
VKGVEWERQQTCATSQVVVVERGCTPPARGATTGHLTAVFDSSILLSWSQRLQEAPYPSCLQQSNSGLSRAGGARAVVGSAFMAAMGGLLLVRAEKQVRGKRRCGERERGVQR